MQNAALALRAQGRRIGFVPTMGYLHEGHGSLMRLAREHSDVLVVSIFVNPTQFGPNEDFSKYPRDFERDEELCRREKTDVVFYPSAADMYPSDSSVAVVEEKLSRGLCGASRPGHFRGVCTVVGTVPTDGGCLDGVDGSWAGGYRNSGLADEYVMATESWLVHY